VEAVVTYGNKVRTLSDSQKSCLRANLIRNVGKKPAL
jgi:hypothetical protein